MQDNPRRRYLRIYAHARRRPFAVLLTVQLLGWVLYSLDMFTGVIYLAAAV